jgi:hypothetical protein
MENKLTNSSNVLIAGILAKAKSNAGQRVIETEMLDGSFTVQTIGSSATRIEVEHYCSTATRRILQSTAAAGEPVKVYWRDKVYTGLISGGTISWEQWSRIKTNYADKVTFVLLVTAEADQ